MDRMAILAKTQKRHEGKSEGGGVTTTPPLLLRERELIYHILQIFIVSYQGRSQNQNLGGRGGGGISALSA